VASALALAGHFTVASEFAIVVDESLWVADRAMRLE
jgi:hypothetical protein